MPKDLTSELLTNLLTKMSADPVEAGLLYTKLHDSLVRYFENKGLSEPEAAADETIDRVARRLAEETVIDDVTKFAFGVARFVVLETLRHDKVRFRANDEFQRDAEQRATGGELPDETLERLRRCVSALYESDRRLLFEYFGEPDGGNRRSEHRARLAERERLSLNALRNRVTRLKEKLARCLGETN